MDEKEAGLMSNKSKGMTSKSEVKSGVELFGKTRRAGVKMNGKVGMVVKDIVDGVSSCA